MPDSTPAPADETTIPFATASAAGGGLVARAAARVYRHPRLGVRPALARTRPHPRPRDPRAC